MNNDSLFLVKYVTADEMVGVGLEDGQGLKPLEAETTDDAQKDFLDWLLKMSGSL